MTSIYSDDEEGPVVLKKSSTKRILDSDEEPTDEPENEASHSSDSDNDETENKAGSWKKRYVLQVENDSDSESFHNSIDKSDSIIRKEVDLQGADDNSLTSSTVDAPTSQDEKSFQPSAKSNPIKNKHDIMKTLAALGDPESDLDSDEEPANNFEKSSKKFQLLTSNSKSYSYDSEENEKNDLKDSSSKKTKKSKPERKSKQNAMLEIKAESQRMLRQSDVGLPYHLPKQRSLQDFLNRRRSTPLPMKGTSDELLEAWKEIEKREKDAKQFYKSDSENEEDNEPSEESDKKNDGTKDEIKQVESDCAQTSVESCMRPTAELDKEQQNKASTSDEESLILAENSENSSSALIQPVASLLEDDKKKANNEKVDEIDQPKLVETESDTQSQKVEEILTETKSDHFNDDKNCSYKTDTPPLSSDFILKLSEDIDEAKNNIDEIISEKTETQTEDLLNAIPNLEEKLSNVSEANKKYDFSLFNSKLNLRGDPDKVIELEDSKPIELTTPGVQLLIDRLMKHTSEKKKTPKTVQLNVISSEKDSGGDVVGINEETLNVVIPVNGERTDNPTPGAKLKLLKSELFKKMKKQKEEEWKKKVEEMENERVFNGEKDECGVLDLSDEEEEMSDSSAESEPEIDDVREPKSRKWKKKAFADEEAEEEDDDGEDADNEENNSDNDADDFEEPEDDSTSVNEHIQSKSNRFDKEELAEGVPSSVLKRNMTSADLFASQESINKCNDSDDSDILPAAQPNRCLTTTPNDSKVENHKTYSPIFSQFSLPFPEKVADSLTNSLSDSPTCKKSFNWNLFPEKDTQESVGELMRLCSGEFTDTQNSLSGIGKLAESQYVPESESELMALCSGKFITQRPEGDEATLNQKDAISQLFTPNSISSTAVAEESQDLSLKWDEDSKKEKVLDHDSPVQETVTDPEKKSLNFELAMMSSDDEEYASAKKTRQPKKRNRKLDFSDEESDEDDDAMSDASKEADSVVPPKEVFYDSDENEIEPAAFFENEAELSEEDHWNGSDDENEEGLDQMEALEADKEQFDEDELREQIVKNHLQKDLDEDRRGVRILQEMFLEDGELHSEGGGRERQFRWKNVDSTGMSNDLHNSDDERQENEEDEEDAEWRRQRHDREMFLMEQRKKLLEGKGNINEDHDDVIENSELLQLGRAVLHKTRSNLSDGAAPREPIARKSSPSILTSPVGKKDNKTLVKRGSFLSRGDNVLSRLAQITGGTKENVTSGAKHSRNFIFTTVSPTKAEQTSKFDEPKSNATKRKATFMLQSCVEKKQCLTVKRSFGIFEHL